MSKFVVAGLLAGTLFGGAALAAQATPAPDAQPRAPRAMPKIDTDGSGTISRAEMLAAAEARFARRDANGDGQLSGDEMRAPHKHRSHRGQRGHRGGHRGHGDMLKHLDTNGDGVVTRAEAEAAGATRAAKHFDRIDANKDGRVDQAEVAQVRAQMKARWQQRKAERQTAPKPAGE
ncbi:EF hand domain-containing protein [Hephaestia caeni]|uniref:EF hand domain-containing protein n=1 Tax=Hephaestia caeni TaxID=645617 RepID=A0A397PLT8_9SPHN|nr:calcium sensor EFh [Hephaestia caeni]RIA46651.1 EF hand domain-containing protein [Hephaestia caeni]